MAELTLEIGPLTSSKIATDANAQRVLESVFALYHDEPGGYTNQQKLDYIVQVLIPQFLVGRAHQYEERQAIEDAKDDLRNDPPEF